VKPLLRRLGKVDAGTAYQASELLKKLPVGQQLIASKLSWLLLIPLFDCVWIWVPLLRTSPSFEAIGFNGKSSVPSPIGVASAYSVLLFLFNPNWAWVVALILFVPYRKRLLHDGKENRTNTSSESPLVITDA
jgi:hypothetical protein